MRWGGRGEAGRDMVAGTEGREGNGGANRREVEALIWKVSLAYLCASGS